jgi:hypothetical protein
MPLVLRSVLFVDFDNVFFSLQRADKDAAKAFANDPQGWLDAIESGRLIDEDVSLDGPIRRRILMRRCYANPAVMRYFRSWFTRSGFQIVDCPSLTGQGKNSADISMVVDMLDALRHDTHFDEFIILSGDADFTPVLTRLRAHDRRSVIYSNAVTAAAYKSLCDGMITEERLIDLAVGEPVEEAEPAPRGEPRPEAARLDFRPQSPEPRQPGPRVDEDYVAEPRSGDRPSAERPHEPRPESRSFDPARPDPRQQQRRRPPGRPNGMPDEPSESGGRLPPVPPDLLPLVKRIAAATNVPPYAPEIYAALFRAIAAEVRERGFSLNRTVNGVIRRLGDQGLRLRGPSIAFVIKGLMLSGHVFEASDTAGTLARAFRRQVLYLASNADIVLVDGERLAVGAWIAGALKSASSTEPAEAEDAPSDVSLAAEAAGVPIEEAAYPMEGAAEFVQSDQDGEAAKGEEAADADDPGDGSTSRADPEDEDERELQADAGGEAGNRQMNADTGSEDPGQAGDVQAGDGPGFGQPETRPDSPARTVRDISQLLARIRTPRS